MGAGPQPRLLQRVVGLAERAEDPVGHAAQAGPLRLEARREAVDDAGIPRVTRLLVEVRASQINGCGVCLDMHTRELAHLGEAPERIALVAAWREAPYYTDAEWAALALTEAATRMADRADPVPDAVWAAAAEHYDEPQLGALVVGIATINAWNRIQATTRQVGGEWVEGVIATAAG